MTAALPVLDLSHYRDPAARRSFVSALRAALHEVGFLHLVGHGVPEATSDAALLAARRFFALAEEDRLAIANVRSPQFRGYAPLGTERTNGRPDHREQIDIGPELAAPVLGADSPAWLRLRGPNLWPPALPELRNAFTAWMAEMQAMGRTVLRAVAEVLAQPAGHFDALLLPHPEDRIKVIRYPADDSPRPTEQGVGAHRDGGLLTFIRQDGVGGLQVERDGTFMDVEPTPGAFVVNIGEMLQLLSHGYLRATVHRVLTPPAGRERLSLAYFFNPAYEATLAPVALPAELAAAAPGGASTDPANPILASYGANALKVRLRSHPDVARLHHADLLGADLQGPDLPGTDLRHTDARLGPPSL